MPRQQKRLPPLALEFMEWEQQDVADREPALQRDWCLEHGIPESTPARWKRSPNWDMAKETLDYEEAMSEGNIAEVVSALHRSAMQGDVQAMKAYVQYAADLEEPDDAEIRGMTDIALASALEAAALEVRARASA